MHNPIVSLFAAVNVGASDLAKMTGLSYTCCDNVLNNSRHRVRSDTAEAIAAALETTVDTLFHPLNITNTGRAPFTNGANTRSTRRKHHKICPVHHLEMPLSGICSDCYDLGPMRLRLV